LLSLKIKAGQTSFQFLASLEIRSYLSMLSAVCPDLIAQAQALVCLEKVTKEIMTNLQRAGVTL